MDIEKARAGAHSAENFARVSRALLDPEFRRHDGAIDEPRRSRGRVQRGRKAPITKKTAPGSPIRIKPLGRVARNARRIRAATRGGMRRASVVCASSRNDGNARGCPRPGGFEGEVCDQLKSGRVGARSPRPEPHTADPSVNPSVQRASRLRCRCALAGQCYPTRGGKDPRLDGRNYESWSAAHGSSYTPVRRVYGGGDGEVAGTRIETGAHGLVDGWVSSMRGRRAARPHIAITSLRDEHESRQIRRAREEVRNSGRSVRGRRGKRGRAGTNPAAREEPRRKVAALPSASPRDYGVSSPRPGMRLKPARRGNAFSTFARQLSPTTPLGP